MSLHNYPRSALVPDYIRAGIGVALTAGPLLLVKPATVMVYILGCLAALFLVFGFRTYLRQAAWLEVAAEGVRAVGLFGAAIPWQELRNVELRFFSTQRSRRDGWMQLKIRGAGKVIRVDSTISEFPSIARTAAMRALERGVELDEHTRANFQSLGVELPEHGHLTKAQGDASGEGGGAG